VLKRLAAFVLNGEFLCSVNRFRVRFLALKNVLRSSVSGTGSAEPQPREDN
jgi:hypothetical protein